MAISVQTGPRSCWLQTRPSGISAERWVTTGSFVLMLVLGCGGIALQASAMFVTPPEKKAVPSTTAKKTEATQPPEEAPSGDTHPENVKLRTQLLEIKPVPAEKRKVISKAFTRMSGQNDELKPVVIPLSSIEKVQAPPQDISEPIKGPERIFTIGSWAFILACVGAAAIGLLKIRKLTSPR